MLESIMKIKASLAVLVEQQKDKFILMKIQDQYLQNALIQLDLEPAPAFCCDDKMDYINFLNDHERDVVLEKRKSQRSSLGNILSRFRRRITKDIVLPQNAGAKASNPEH